MKFVKDVECTNVMGRSKTTSRIFTAYHPFVSIQSLGYRLVRPSEKVAVLECKYILASTDYFSKWTEAIPICDFISLTILDFIRIHIMNGFSILETATPNNGPSKVRRINYMPSIKSKEITPHH